MLDRLVARIPLDWEEQRSNSGFRSLQPKITKLQVPPNRTARIATGENASSKHEKLPESGTPSTVFKRKSRLESGLFPQTGSPDTGTSRGLCNVGQQSSPTSRNVAGTLPFRRLTASVAWRRAASPR